MCYSGCKYEDFEGDCRRGRRLIDDDCHCFDGFRCWSCEKLKDEEEESNTVGLCIDCYNERDEE